MLKIYPKVFNEKYSRNRKSITIVDVSHIMSFFKFQSVYRYIIVFHDSIIMYSEKL